MSRGVRIRSHLRPAGVVLRRSIPLLAALAGGGCGPSADDRRAVVAPLRFVDVTVEAGLPTASNTCLVFRDLDGDRRPDLLLAPLDDRGIFGGALVLHRNRGDGRFEPHPIPIPLHFVGGCDVADVDGDGVLDVAVTGGADEEPLLLRGTSIKGTFRIEPLGGVVGQGVVGIDLADLDADGAPDLFVRRYTDMRSDLRVTSCGAEDDGTLRCYLGAPPIVAPPSLYTNRDGRFTASPIAFDADRITTAVACMDWDGDGRLDLLATNDFGVDAFYRVNRDNSVLDLLPARRAARYNHGMGAAFGDFDRDGRWDLYLVELGADALFFGTATGGLEDRGAQLGLKDLTRHHSGYGPSAADFDNDGWLDLFVPNPGIVESTAELFDMAFLRLAGTRRRQADFVLHNQGGARFAATELPHRRGGPSFVAAASAIADYDGDGRVDVAEVLWTSHPEVHLYRNESAAGHWLGVRLADPRGHATRGAVVTVDTDDGTDRRVASPGGSGGVSDDVIYFGLATRPSIRGLSVRWPDGATLDVPGPIAADRVVDVLR